MKTISLVIPSFNEEDNIPIIYSAVKKVIGEKYDYEIIFVDNDSQDNSQRIIEELCQSDPHVRAIFNNRNFGPENSMFNGVLSARGDAVIYLACDLQDPPDMIPMFLQHWEEGASVVWGQKESSEERFLMYKVRSLYYYIIKRLSSVESYSHVTGFGLYDRSVVARFRQLRDPWPMFRHIVPQLGYRPVLIPYKQPLRKAWKSSYCFFRYFDTALNSLVHTSKVPLKLAIYFGLIASIISVFVGVFYFVYKLFFWETLTVGTAPIIILLSLTSSVLMLFLGLLGEYIIAILERVSFTQYVYERRRINFDPEPDDSSRQPHSR